MGTAQGSALSPLLGNVYLHYTLDLWFERDVKPRLLGKATLLRYADDLVIAFERGDDAQRVMRVLSKRMERFCLRLHPDKTRLLDFRRPPGSQKSGQGPGTFDFVGFTFYWARSRQGRWGMHVKTRRVSLKRAITSAAQWCRRYRHQSVREQRVALGRKLQGHYAYFGVSGNYRSLMLLYESVKRSWFKWRCRRSQRRRLTWERFADLLSQQELPRPRIRVRDG